MKKTNMLWIIGIIIATLLIGLVNARPAIYLMNNSFNVVNTQPTIWFNYTDEYNATANCIVYIDSIAKGSNSSVVNLTATAITTSNVGYGVYNTYVTCTVNNTNSNTTGTINVGNIMYSCGGADRTIAYILIGMFMIGILVFAVMQIINSGGDVKLIIGIGIGVILLVIAIAIFRPIFQGVCGV